MNEPEVRVTQYTISVFPDTSINQFPYSITVEYRGRDRWVVLRGKRALGRDGAWSYEPPPGSREDEWIDAHRFTATEAIALARDWAPKIICNGSSAEEIQAREVAQARHATRKDVHARPGHDRW